jgi:hypothetical protein
MTSQLVVFVQGICAAAAWAVGLLFFRFWYDGRDRLFAFFAVGFWLLSASWALLAVENPSAEAQPYIYGIRLVAFLLIIVAIIDKNRAPRA